MTIATIKDPIYGAKITFICKEPRERTLRFLENYKPAADDKSWEDRMGTDGFVCEIEWNRYLFILPLETTINELHSTIAHEAFHITARLLRHCGIELCYESEEAFAYYLGWLIESFTKIYSKGKPMKAKAASKKRKQPSSPR